MKVLVIGKGGREHAIVHAVSRSKRVNKLYAAPGNPGMQDLAECDTISTAFIFYNSDKSVYAALENVPLPFSVCGWGGAVIFPHAKE